MRATSRIGLGLAAAAIFVFFLAPIAWIVLASVQPETAITQDPPQLTLHLDLSHYREVIRIADFWHSAWVSVQLSVITTIGTIVVGALTAYPLARLRVPGRSAVLAVLIFSTMMPAIVLAIPVLLMANKTGLRDTVIVLVLVNVAFQLPIVIWLLTNFFEAVPQGGDCYILSRILHDWDDARARRILEVCHAAMAPGSRLLLVEAVLPERAVENPAAIRMDLHMLLLLPGRERTAAEFAELLQGTGFRIERVIAPTSGTGVHVIEAIRAAD